MLNLICHCNSPNTGYGLIYSIIKRNLQHTSNSFETDTKTLIISTPTNKFKDLKNFGCLTMWETNSLPKEAIINLNKSAFIIVFSKHNYNVFTQSSITTPIYIIPPFYNPSVSLLRNSNSKLTLGTIFNSESYQRKNIDFLVSNFIQFSQHIDIELQIKTDFQYSVNHPKIKVINKILSQEEMNLWYSQVDCYVSCSKGEGIGLCLLEAASSGCFIISPTIYLDFINKDHCFELDTGIEKASYYYESAGDWFSIQKKSLMNGFNYVYNNQNDIKKIGILNSEYIKKFNIKNTIQELTHILKKHEFA